MLKISKVKGKSMSPVLNDGDYVLSVSKNPKKLRIGDIIIFKNAVHGRMIKKISSKEEKGFKIKGLHPDSSDSKTLGIISYSDVIGKLIMRFPKKTKNKKK